MKIVVAPNTFKGTISARQVGEALKKGLLQADPDLDVVLVPIADGGDGSLVAIADIFGGYIRTTPVSGPLGSSVDAGWSVINSGKTVFIETALVFGLALLRNHERNPYITSSCGIGELITFAFDEGYRDFIVGVGGSANNDAGTGMLKALGCRFLDKGGYEIPNGGYFLKDLNRIDISGLDERVSSSSFKFLNDSEVPLLGEIGVSLMYAPGKGASAAMARELDSALTHYCSVFREQFGYSYGSDVGTGSGGGITSAAEHFLGAEVEFGSQFFLDKLDFNSKLFGADLLITGEGMIDEQTIYNKAPIAVAKVAKGLEIPVVSVNAVLGRGYEAVFEHGIDSIICGNADGGSGKVVYPEDLSMYLYKFWKEIEHDEGLKLTKRIYEYG